MRRINILVVLSVMLLLLSGCSQDKKEEKDKTHDTTNIEIMEEEQENPDYEVKNISMSQKEQEEIVKKLLSIVEECKDIYSQIDKGENSDLILEDTTVHQMIGKAASLGYSVTCGSNDYNMQNYETVDEVIWQAEEGKEVQTEFYVINRSGVFGCKRLEFADGRLTVTYVSAILNSNMEPQINYMEKIQVYQWEYTDKGWLIWEKALSRNPEMDMHVFHRILPLDDECREIARKCIIPVSYFCNNLFLTDWDMEHLEQIEFNDLFDFLYAMKTGSKLDASKYQEGIPQEEFESIIQSYFDISAEKLRECARYDEEKGTYPWSAIGPWNRVPQLQPFPEVVRYEENEDGTLSVYVEAIFTEMGLDCSFGHMVTIREDENGGWVYCGNKVDWENAYSVPKYKARSSGTG